MCSGPFRTGTATGLVWLNRGPSGSEGLMTSVPLVVFPIAPHILDGLGRRTGRVLAVRGEQQQGCDGGQRAEDPDFALHQTSPTLAREGCLQVSAPPADALGRTVNLRRLGLVRPQNYHILRNLDYGGLRREVVPSAQRVYAAASRFVLSTNGAPCVRLIWRSVWGQRARELAGRQSARPLIGALAIASSLR